MYHKTILFIFLINFTLWSQTDYSEQWEDFFSYNNVKEFVNTDTQLVALCENALFIYDKQNATLTKRSSVNGLSGETTSALYYDEINNTIFIGYESGLIEIIDAEGNITSKPNIVNFNILGSKRINHMFANDDNLYISTPFGIVIFGIDNLEFKDTLFIGDLSSEVYVNEIAVANNNIIATTTDGIYVASLDETYLIDYNNWSRYASGNFTNITTYNNQVFTAKGNELYKLENDFTLSYINTHPQPIIDLKSGENYLCVSSVNQLNIYNENLSLVYQTASNINPDYSFTVNTALVSNNKLLIGTHKYGILSSNLNTINDYEEIHPEGPLSNQVFSISVADDNLWVVYGGYDPAYTPLSKGKNASHFNGEHWIEIPFANDAITEYDLVDVTIDPNAENKVYISSWGSGMVIVENDVVTNHWNSQNSGLESLILPGAPDYVSIRIGSSTIDDTGNLWVVNAWIANRIKKFDGNNWTSYDLSSTITNSIALGLNEIVIDRSGNKWVGTRRNGALVLSKNGNQKMALTTEPSKGNLPDPNVRAIAVDKNNRIWIGTRSGLTVFNSSSAIFNNEVYAAQQVVIDYGQDDNYGEALLGNQNINTICIDGADNKWFGTDSGGVLYTNPSGKETLLQFNKDNSPLPSNRILKIRFDDTTGKVYFATDKGIVAYKSGVSPFGEHLEDVYAYPNPALKQHEYITIDGRNGTHIPNGTNVKILDASGKLVYETNVKEGQERFGGKVVWNKTNLAGKKVASGIYIVLLTTEDTSETRMTKIAIIN